MSALVFSQEKFSEATMIKTSDSILKISDKRIDNSKTKKTIHSKKGGLKIIEYYDHENNLVKKTSENKNTSIVLSGPRTEVYDINNNVILEKNQDIHGAIWFLSILEYTNGQLVLKTTFDLEYIYKVKFIISSGKEETYSIYYNTNGDVVEPKQLPERLKPYTAN